MSRVYEDTSLLEIWVVFIFNNWVEFLGTM